MIKNFSRILFCVLVLFIIASNVSAQKTDQLHPINKKLVVQGLMPVPKYYPHIPRIPAQTAYGLYLQNKALFVYISYKDLHQIVNSIHLKEKQAATINPNRLPFKPGQICVVY